MKCRHCHKEINDYEAYGICADCYDEAVSDYSSMERYLKDTEDKNLTQWDKFVMWYYDVDSKATYPSALPILKREICKAVKSQNYRDLIKRYVTEDVEEYLDWYIGENK